MEDPAYLLIDQNVDAQEWAKSFIHTVQSKDIKIDENLMLSWFAAAIENAKDWQCNKIKKATNGNN